MNSIEMKTEERQAKILELMKIFDEVCTSNNIQYSLIAGSVLGAVREKGFIPWDTDMDVIVPNTQFKILREKLTERIANEENLELYMWDKTPKYAEVVDRLGFKDIPNEYIHLDIFPLIGAPSNRIMQKIFSDICFYSYRLLRCKHCNTEFSKPSHVKKINMIKKFVRIIPDYMIIGWYHLLEKLYSLDKAKYAYLIASGYGMKELLEKNIYLITEKAKFCDTEFNIPQESKTYLTTVYGDDYMTPKRSGTKKMK